MDNESLLEVYGGGPMSLGEFGVALACENGHMLESAIGHHPDFRTPTVNDAQFCSECGAKTLTKCPNCDTSIRGYHPYKEVRLGMYCHRCGERYPWLDKKLKAARDLAVEAQEFSDEDRDILSAALPEIAANTPETELASVRFLTVLKKASGAIRDGLYNLTVDIASETALKILKANTP